MQFIKDMENFIRSRQRKGKTATEAKKDLMQYGYDEHAARGLVMLHWERKVTEESITDQIQKRLDEAPKQQMLEVSDLIGGATDCDILGDNMNCKGTHSFSGLHKPEEREDGSCWCSKCGKNLRWPGENNAN